MSEVDGPIEDFSHHHVYLELQQKFITLLDKYGDLPWTTELDMVSQYFEKILSQACLFSPINFCNLRRRGEKEKLLI